jgi:hypothetical protein
MYEAFISQAVIDDLLMLLLGFSVNKGELFFAL